MNLICPVSTQRINGNVARVTAFMLAALAAMYALTGFLPLVMLMAVDFFIRAYTERRYSPLSWLASRAVDAFDLGVEAIDKAPKVFAARVGLLFTFAALALFPFSPVASAAAMLVLMCFALLEALFNFCVGCLVYTYLVFPFFNRAKQQPEPISSK